MVSTQTRVYQDDHMLYDCIINSLSVQGKVKLKAQEIYYMINYLPSGMCLFKMLVRESYLDYNDTSGMVCTHLSNLDT